MRISAKRPEISIAPMMDWTDRHCRYFLRLIAPDILLYTEMVTANAILHGDKQRLLAFDASEHPLALQLGGSDPDDLAAAARIAADNGYDEINLNIGCPSDRVQSGQFGACLMATPELVRDCVAAMRDAVDIPVTVKTRIGIDDHDSYQFLDRFVTTVAESGCDTFVVHARIALLGGLSPKQNREVPPLRYDYVARLKKEHPGLSISLNGGIADTESVKNHLQTFDGVMIGRQAYHHPYWLAELQTQVLNRDGWSAPTRDDIVRAFVPYVESELAKGTSLQSMTRHVLGLFAGQPGARRWRRYLSENATKAGAGADMLLSSLDVLQPAA